MSLSSQLREVWSETAGATVPGHWGHGSERTTFILAPHTVAVEVQVPQGTEQGASFSPQGPGAVHDRAGAAGRGAAARAAAAGTSDAEAAGDGVQQDPPGAAGDGEAVSVASQDTPSLPSQTTVGPCPLCFLPTMS